MVRGSRCKASRQGHLPIRCLSTTRPSTGPLSASWGCTCHRRSGRYFQVLQVLQQPSKRRLVLPRPGSKIQCWPFRMRRPLLTRIHPSKSEHTTLTGSLACCPRQYRLDVGPSGPLIQGRARCHENLPSLDVSLAMGNRAVLAHLGLVTCLRQSASQTSRWIRSGRHEHHRQDSALIPV